MATTQHDLAVLAADIAYLHTYVTGDASPALEPAHFTTCGYEHAITAAAARRTANRTA